MITSLQPRRRGNLIDPRTIHQHAPWPSPAELESTDPQTAALAWYTLSRHTLLEMTLSTAHIALLKANERVSRTNDTHLHNDIKRALVFRCSDFAHCRPDTRKHVEPFAEAVDGLYDNVVQLLRDPKLANDSLGTTLIVMEFSEVLLPYVQMTLATYAGPLSTDVRESLLLQLRQAETLFTSTQERSGDAFVEAGGELVHTRYYDNLSNLRCTIGYVERYR